MTLQDLLREATRLYLKEQVQLATQLLQLVDQQIAIASESKVSKTDRSYHAHSKRRPDYWRKTKDRITWCSVLIPPTYPPIYPPIS